MEKEEVKISVRELVEFILRSGDIDNRRGGWADKESLAKGTRIHKKIQRQMGAAYQGEVPLNYRFCYEDLDILVEGRADGIEEKEDHVMVDEIKGAHRDSGLWKNRFWFILRRPNVMRRSMQNRISWNRWKCR